MRVSEEYDVSEDYARLYEGVGGIGLECQGIMLVCMRVSEEYDNSV